jgi:hypothetical protein
MCAIETHRNGTTKDSLQQNPARSSACIRLQFQVLSEMKI